MPSLNVSKITAHIYDWQLVPIARFADSDNGAAMTLFGKLEDEQFQQQILDEDGRVMNYHPAFDNTLVGLRLMQADILLFDENATDLPRNARGYVLGAGESSPNVGANQQRFEAVQALPATVRRGRKLHVLCHWRSGSERRVLCREW
jgi:hypothetical protein